ncbi:MAG: C-GCAxxG-C-C family (seleno)protein [Peptostreptococcaceae bacterium]
MTKPSVYHKEGYTCAEALIKSYNEEHNTDIPVALGSGMGVGMTVGSICGAVNAAAMVVGYIKGRESNSETNVARNYSRELMTKVRDRYNTEICADLKRNKVSCAEIIDFSYDALNEILDK